MLIFTMPRTSKTTTAKKPAAAKAAAQAFLFFNCDGEKSEKSKNVFYNHEVFRDMGVGRKALWAKIQEELAAGHIQIAEENKAAAQEAVLSGNPVDAGPYIQFGDIFAVECH